MSAWQPALGHRRPRVPWPAALLGGAGVGWLLATGGQAPWNRRSRSGRQAHADAAHHRLLPMLHAAERALQAGEVELGLVHLRSAGLVARTELRSAAPGRDPVVSAVSRTRQVWREQLSLETLAVEPLPERVPPAARRALRDLTLEGLNNIARHQPGATAHLALRVEDDRILFTLTARGGHDPLHGRPNGEDALSDRHHAGGTRAASAADGYGLAALRRTVRDAGGEVRLHLVKTGSVLEADLPRRRGLRRRR